MTRWIMIALLVGCGSVECEQVAVIPGGFEMTCVHECGMVLQMGDWMPGPTCEWERGVCQERCALGR